MLWDLWQVHHGLTTPSSCAKSSPVRFPLWTKQSISEDEAVVLHLYSQIFAGSTADETGTIDLYYANTSKLPWKEPACNNHMYSRPKLQLCEKRFEKKDSVIQWHEARIDIKIADLSLECISHPSFNDTKK